MFVLDEGGDQTKLNRCANHDGCTRREMLRLAKIPYLPDTRDSAQVRGRVDGQMPGKMLVVETESSLSAIARVNLSVQRREK